MFLRKIGSTVAIAAATTAIAFVLINGGTAHAAPLSPLKAPAQGVVQQTAPMTATMRSVSRK